MKIIDRLKEDRIHISFEVFPPKTDEGIDKAVSYTHLTLPTKLEV